MRPVAIFRHAPIEGPGYFAIFLERHGIPWRLIAIDEGEALPLSTEAFSGLCLMGGPMSVNDPLPWIEPACRLIREAAANNLPVIGHCLGAQLMSKALGGLITKNPFKEIGWGEISCEDTVVARHWLGPLAGSTGMAFHWHGETFGIPAGASRIVANAYCANQMFALGPHLGMQCHVEMTPDMIAAWCEHWADETQGATGQPCIQTPQVMQAEIVTRLPAMRQLSDQLYSVWVQGLKR